MKKTLTILSVAIILIFSFSFGFAKEESSEDILFIGNITKIGQDSVKFKLENGHEYSALINGLTHITDKSYDEINFEKLKKGHHIRVRGVLAEDNFHIFTSFLRDASIK